MICITPLLSVFVIWLFRVQFLSTDFQIDLCLPVVFYDFSGTHQLICLNCSFDMFRRNRVVHFLFLCNDLQIAVFFYCGLCFFSRFYLIRNISSQSMSSFFFMQGCLYRHEFKFPFETFQRDCVVQPFKSFVCSYMQISVGFFLCCLLLASFYRLLRCYSPFVILRLLVVHSKSFDLLHQQIICSVLVLIPIFCYIQCMLILVKESMSHCQICVRAKYFMIRS